ncbi:hypothetical protein LWC08_09125 [Desulfobaculum bizertense]|uniref:hypothetical protein n=1 Tax=Desulfobaculum bizertense TaxID=376490 RepID=UPI001F35DB76|nr:hypothetical protein [Desulfobaculum bizertense]UIJ36901.1 hypothetical protein LWC08_09125 [Desulfobaculum bizertense]
MQIYHYDPETGALIGTGTAEANPMEPGQFLVPAYATTVAPPELGEGEYPYFKAGVWETGSQPDEVPEEEKNPAPRHRYIDGEKISETTRAALEHAQSVEELRDVMATILLGRE